MIHKPDPLFLSAISRPFRTARRRVPICYHLGVSRGNTGKIAGEFIKHVVPAVIKPARTLWNEVIGFIFICLGVSFGFRVVLCARSGETFKAVVCTIGTLVMAYYGVTSFLRARKISRS